MEYSVTPCLNCLQSWIEIKRVQVLYLNSQMVLKDAVRVSLLEIKWS